MLNVSINHLNKFAWLVYKPCTAPQHDEQYANFAQGLETYIDLLGQAKEKEGNTRKTTRKPGSECLTPYVICS